MNKLSKIPTRHLVGSAVAIAINLIGVQASADDSVTTKQRDRGRVYGGIGTMPLSISGLADVHASDWENYGTGDMEGRVNLPLEGGNTSEIVRPGACVGYEIDLGVLPVFGELSIFPGSMNVFTVLVGTKLGLLSGKDWSLGLAPGVGVMLATMELGEVEVIPGKTPPVITPMGTFYEGDPLSASIGGLMLSGDVVFGMRLSDKLELRLKGGLQYALLGELQVKAGEVVLEQDAASLVRNDGSTTQAGIDPNGSSVGMSLLAGVAYEL